MEVKLTDKAIDKLNELYPKMGAEEVIRISAEDYNCAGVKWEIECKEPKDSDIRLTVDGFNMAIDEGASESYCKFKVDYSENFLRSAFIIVADKTEDNC